MEKRGDKELQKEELYDIILPILSHIDILHSEHLKTNFKKAKFKLLSLRTDYKNSSMNNFVFFLQNLFFNKKQNFDFELKKIYMI